MEESPPKVPTPEDEAEMLRLKALGNDALAIGHYLQAIDFYSEALEHVQTNAIVLSNRALAFIKVENYGLAIADATEAIACDPNYAKGYYRRGTAEFALSKPKAARKDFRAVCKLKPKDRDARSRLQACEKAVREAAFAAAIFSTATAPLTDTYDPSALPIDPVSYDGPHPSGDLISDTMETEIALFQPGNLPMEFVMVGYLTMSTSLLFFICNSCDSKHVFFYRFFSRTIKP
jgi:serine/threonine-protein phosphatase 5